MVSPPSWQLFVIKTFFPPNEVKGHWCDPQNAGEPIPVLMFVWVPSPEERTGTILLEQLIACIHIFLGMAWSLPTQECVHHIVWQLLGKSPTRWLSKCRLESIGLQPCQESSSSDSFPPPLVNLRYPKHLCGQKFVVNYLFLWQTMHHGKTWRPPTTVWSIFCSCPDSQSHVQTGNLRKFSLEDWATSFRKLFSQVVTSLLCSHDLSFISCPGLLSGP